MKNYQSWGNYPKVGRQQILAPAWKSDPIPFDSPSTTFLPYGQGRSYGDSCLNEGGTLLDTAFLDRYLAFDRQTGILRCEGGVTLEEILNLIVPAGWFLPVTPGTKYVSVGGCIANDVHGKNHHGHGTFGCHVTQFELLRSDGKRIHCSPQENDAYYRATIGGLGLTGLILWAEIKLKKIKNSLIDAEYIKFSSLQDFFALCRDSDKAFEYTVAWFDCFSTGRGIFIRGNHAKEGETVLSARRKIKIPFSFPSIVLNPLTMRLFNQFYYAKQSSKVKHFRTHYDPFFYPLDAVVDWNKIYGKRGLLQYQCALPEDAAEKHLKKLFEEISSSGMGSFLAVLKAFGALKSPGMLSFPKKGYTLALDFPNYGGRLLKLLEKLDDIVKDAGGTVYPAKDARMSSASFRRFYPQWEEWERYKDPKFSSSFWRRVMGEKNE